MNGSHAELFTFCLYHNLLTELDKASRLQPLRLDTYYSPVGTDVEPGIRLVFRDEEYIAHFKVEFLWGQFMLFVHPHNLEKWPDLLSWLIAFGFSDVGGSAAMLSSPEDIEAVIVKLAQDLAVAFPSS